MVDLGELRETIEHSPPERRRSAAIVSLDWLKEVERDLSELARLREQMAQSG